jgi:hypothetical protein
MLAFTVKGIFILFGAIGLATIWEAVFADMGTALIAVANSTRIVGKNNLMISIKNSIASLRFLSYRRKPER